MAVTLRTKTTPVLITNESTITPETIRSTTGGISAIGQDPVGTSFQPESGAYCGCIRKCIPKRIGLIYTGR